MNALYNDFHSEKSVFNIIKIVCFSEENPNRISDKFFFEDVQNPPTVNISQEYDMP